jgi:hypothetical protein
LQYVFFAASSSLDLIIAMKAALSLAVFAAAAAAAFATANPTVMTLGAGPRMTRMPLKDILQLVNMTHDELFKPAVGDFEYTYHQVNNARHTVGDHHSAAQHGGQLSRNAHRAR